MEGKFAVSDLPDMYHYYTVLRCLTFKRHIRAGYEEGLVDGRESGWIQGWAAGIEAGRALGKELGVIYGRCLVWQLALANTDERFRRLLSTQLKALRQYGMENVEDEDKEKKLDQIRARQRQLLSMGGQTSDRATADTVSKTLDF